MPWKCFMTGIFASAATRRIRLSPPRGMARSMNSGRPSRIADGRAVGRGDKLHGVVGKARGRQLVGQHPVQGAVGVDRLLAAPKDGRVAALDAECGGVDGHVGPALVDHEDDAQRDADLAHVEPVGPPARADDLADRVGQGGDLEERPGHLVDPLRD